MNLNVSLKYQLHDSRKAIIIFYGVVIALILLTIVSTRLFDNSFVTTKGTIGGIEITTMVFLFVLGMNSFKETFKMFVQNGVSRKTMFIGQLLSASLISLGMTMINTIIDAVCKKIVPVNEDFSYESIIEIMYKSRYESYSPGVLMLLEKILFALCMYAAAVMSGYFIAALYYRMGKGAKIAVSVGTPVGLFVVLPVVNTLVFNGRIGRAFGRFIIFAFGYSNGANPYYGMVTLLLISVIFSALSWLLARRAVIKD